MRRTRLASAGWLSLVLACSGGDVSTNMLPDDGGDAPEPVPAEWESVTISEARASLDAGGGDYFEFLSMRTMQAGLLRRSIGASDVPFRLTSSVTYYVLEGEAELFVAGDSVQLTPGTAVFVRGREDRGFREVDPELLVLALISVGRPGLGDPVWRVFGEDELVETRNPNRNVLHRVLETETMSIGTYMLPRELSGDLRVRHGFDELKVVLRGAATLEAGSDVLPVEVGAVVFVDGTVSHRFTRISGDLDVLFVWNR